MKWVVRKLRKNDYITFEGKTIKDEPTEISIPDNPSTIRSVNNTLNRLKNENRIEVLSGETSDGSNSYIGSGNGNIKLDGPTIDSSISTEVKTEVTPDGKEKIIEKVTVTKIVDISNSTKNEIEKILA